MTLNEQESAKLIYGATTSTFSSLEHDQGGQFFLLETPLQISIIDIKSKKRALLKLHLKKEYFKIFPNMNYKCVKYIRPYNRDLLLIVGHASQPESPNSQLGLLMVSYLKHKKIHPVHNFSVSSLPSVSTENCKD